MKKSLALILLLPILGGVFVQQPAEAGFKMKIKTPKVIRNLDPTARNAKYGGVTRSACDAAANVITDGAAGTRCSRGAKAVGEINRQIKR